VRSTTIVVDAIVPDASDHTNLREAAWSLALDQRAFGPRRLLVAFADRDGRVVGMAHTPRTDPIEMALAGCVAHLGAGAAAAVVFNDEPVPQGPPPPDLPLRFANAWAVCAEAGVHLVDWFACDDLAFRSTRLALDLDPAAPWWDLQ
jgi:hypothetical protein